MAYKVSELLNSNPLLASQVARGDGFFVYDESEDAADATKAISLGELAKAFAGFNSSANSSGNTTITPGVICLRHTEKTAVTGSGSTTRVMILAVDSESPPAPGAIIVHRLSLPATGLIEIEWRNATAGGTELTSYVTDDSGDDVVAEFVYNGAAWEFVRFSAPANA